VLHDDNVHVPLVQDSLALARSHVVPHAPQLARVVNAVSHPLPTRPSQSSKPSLHIVSVQVPVAHDSVALARSQAVPHVPQSDSVISEVSHPFVPMLSQLPKSMSHPVSVHVPVAHDSVPFARLQLTPQAPQSVSVVMGVSHPSVTSPLQSSHPASHASTQLLTTHEGVALTVLHAASHAPQWLGSVRRSTQLPPHRSSPAAQPVTQPVAGSQIGVATPQVVVQSPHVAVDERLASQPSLTTPLQSANPGSQLSIAQLPVAHVSAARGSEQAVPHVPQSDVVRSEVSQPVSGAPSQSSKPTSQLTISQLPVVHVSVALLREHAIPQPAQSVSDEVNASQPSSSFALQSA
jgi:hypothetical protein